MAKVISSIQVKGRVSRIYVKQREASISSVTLMLEDDPRVYEFSLNVSPFETSLGLTKPGDDVSFALHKQRAVLLGEYEILVLWKNWSLGIEQTKNGVKPEESIQG